MHSPKLHSLALPAAFSGRVSAGPLAYVANEKSASISIIETTSFKKLTDVEVGAFPWGVNNR